MKTLEHNFDTVEMVPVTWILQNLRSSVDGFEVYDDDGNYSDGVDFQAMMYDKGSDYHFGNILHTITKKGFRVPICLYSVEDGWGMGNGHHRLTAAILLGLDEIPVYWSDYDYMPDGSDTEELLETDGKFSGVPEMIRELWD